MLHELALQSAAIASDTRTQIRQLATELSHHSVLPLIGAGASIDCGAPAARVLANELAGKIERGDIDIAQLPSDFDECRHDLGKLADLIHLDHSPEFILNEIGFADSKRWPSADEIVDHGTTSAHPCAYRVLARMAREQFIAESVTFNYDCHYESGLRTEGFFPERRAIRHGRWPELFTVVADAVTHSSVLARGDFVLNKVHGCVDNWRRVSKSDPDRATKTIVIRWSQLLDWREDWWSRDLVRDRARRHILLLIGFSGLDPVIHSTVQAVMREVLDAAPTGPARIRVLDPQPDQLTLQLLAKAGDGKPGDLTSIRVPIGGSAGLAVLLLALLSELVQSRLLEYARLQGLDPHLPSDPESMELRLAVTGPSMLRWTWALLAKTQHGPHGLAGLSERGDDYYVPLTAEPDRTLRAFQLRDELADLLSISSEDPRHTVDGGFLVATHRGRAYMPLGLHDHEVGALSQTGILDDVGNELRGPAGLERLVAVASPKGPRAFSVDTGREVSI